MQVVEYLRMPLVDNLCGVLRLKLGKADPVADNSTAAGRAQNRRVNLVVSGDAIGVETSQPQTDGQQ